MPLSSRILHISVLALVLVGLACSGEESRVNGWRVEIDEKASEWRVFAPHLDARATEPTLSGPLSGRIADGSAALSSAFGQFTVSLEGDDAETRWSDPLGTVTTISRTPAGVEVTLSDRNGARDARLVFRRHGERDLKIALETDDSDVTAGELGFRCREGEAFFGLGTQITGMDLRGRTYPLLVQEQGIGKPEENGIPPINNIPEAAYAPMGVWHSSAGWSALLGHDAYSELSLCDATSGGEGSNEKGALRSYPLLPSMVLVAGETPRERVRSTTAYTGRLSTPPDWIFAPWNSAVGGPQELELVASTLRDARIPSSVIWTEDWIGGSLTANGFRLSYRWEWDEETYPDLPSRIADLNGRGFAFLGYFNPFIPQNVPTWSEASSSGFTVMRDDGTPYTTRDPAFRQTGMIDLTNADARRWLAGFLRKAVKEVGLQGWMADFAEWMPIEGVAPAGEGDLLSIHNRYPLLWQQVHREVLDEVFSTSDRVDDDYVFFARSGWASVNGGTGGLVPALWGGDQNTDFSFDDGLPSVIPIGAHAGLSGVAIFGSDIAGYASVVNAPSDKQLYFRWVALGAFSPLMRTHHGSSKCDNWRFDRDEETLAHFGRYARIHSLLLPYFRSLVPDAVNDGLPLMRHPWLVAPESPGLWATAQYQYFLGDDLLVAPVIERDATAREVLFPKPGWWPLLGMAPLSSTQGGEGGTWRATVDATYTEIPAFVRPGTALPLLPEVVDSFFGATDPDVTDLSDVAGSLMLALYPDEEGSIRASSYDGVRVSAKGLTSLDGATIDGAHIRDCDGVVDVPCREGGRIHLDVAGSATLGITGGQVEIQTERPTRLTLAIGGDAWGALATPTALSDLTPDLPPLCD